MKQDDTQLLSRLFAADSLPEHGLDIVVVAEPREREAIAQAFKVPSLKMLIGEFHLEGTARRVNVTGRVSANLTQNCVVTLEDFDTALSEEVSVLFLPPSQLPDDPDSDQDIEPLSNGVIDLGRLTLEFFVLGVDPYPRKPGALFEFSDDDAQEDVSGVTAFSRLNDLKKP